MGSVVCRPDIILLEILQFVPIFNYVCADLYSCVRDFEIGEQVRAIIPKLIVLVIAISPSGSKGLGVLPQSVPDRTQEIF